MKRIENVIIIGMGAVGTLFGRTLQMALGLAHVAFLMDEARLERALSHPVLVNGKEEALDTIIVSALNGITSEKILGERFGNEHIVPCVAQAMDATFFDYHLRFQRHGELCLGLFPETNAAASLPMYASGQMSSPEANATVSLPMYASRQTPSPVASRAVSEENLAAVVDLFKRTGVPFVVEEDIRHRMYSKWMCNCGLNQTCMVFDTTYGGVVEAGSEAKAIFYAAMREAMLVANAEGVPLTEDDFTYYTNLTKALTPDSMPSMAQDRKNRKATEVELFAGTLLVLAQKHGLEAPVNEWLYRRIKEIERSWL